MAQRDGKRREAILNGNLLKVVVMIAAPLVLLNLLTYIYGIIDMIVVAGRGSTAVTSVVMVTQLKSLISTLGSGLATGSTIIVSRFIGREDYRGAKACANTFLVVSLGVSVAMVALVTPFSDVILRAAGFDDELLAEGRDYFIVQMFTVGISLVNSTFLGLEKARGAARNVLYVNVAVMAVKVCLTLLLVSRFDLGPVWIAATTLFANLIVSGYGIVRLLQKNYLFRFSIRNTMFKKSVILPYIKLSFPVFLGSFVFNLGKVIVNSLGKKYYGTAATGALGVSNNVAGAVTTLTSATEDAYSMIVSQNLGAGKKDRIVKTFWLSLAINVAIGLVGSLVLYFISDWLIGFFATTDSYNAEYAALIDSIFMLELYGVVFLGVNSACMGFIYGLGYTKLSLVFNLSRLFVLRLPVILIMVFCFPEFGAAGLGLGMLVSNVGVGLVSFGLALWCLARIKKKGIKDKI